MAKANYLPARLMRGKNTWYIVFYQTNPADGIRRRYRETYDLNRVQRIGERLKLARKLIEDINRKLPFGFPYTENDGDLRWQNKTVLDVMKSGLNFTNMSGKKKSIQTRTSHYNNFERFIQFKGYQDLSAVQFSRRHAMEFLDFRLMVDKVSVGKRNDSLMRCNQFWKELIKREYFVYNPWQGIDDMKTNQKERRFLSELEQKAVLQVAQEINYGVLMAIRYLWFCGLRNGEIADLKVRHHNLKAGLLQVGGDDTKNGKRATIPIPSVFLDYLKENIVDLNPEWYVLGKGLKPSAVKCGSNYINNKHHDVLDVCISRNIIPHKKGITFYKWKNTAGKFIIESGVNIQSVKKYWRHSDIKTTYGYFEDFKSENPEIDKTLNKLI